MRYSYQMQNSELGYTLSIWINTVMREYFLELCDKKKYVMEIGEE